jgi:hypothetical protein
MKRRRNHHNACSHCTTAVAGIWYIVVKDMEDPVTYETEMAQVQTIVKETVCYTKYCS